MPRLNPEKIRLCACGCQQPVPLYTDAAGRFKGYARGIPGHRKQQWIVRSHAARMQYLERARLAHTLPLGTKRLHNTGSITYYVIKVGAAGRWPYEHRAIMEQLIGRALHSNEHVHHRNGNTLDNRPDNLELLTASAHSRHHGLIPGWSRQFAACLRCHDTTRAHASRGLCTRCYQRRDGTLPQMPARRND